MMYQPIYLQERNEKVLLKYIVQLYCMYLIFRHKILFFGEDLHFAVFQTSYTILLRMGGA